MRCPYLFELQHSNGKRLQYICSIVQMQTEMVIVSWSSGSAEFIFSFMNKLDHRAARVHNRL